MASDDVTGWIDGLARGDEEAAQKVWQRYYDRLVRLARKKLGEANRRVTDEEDVVLSAFDSFCRGAAAGRFPRLRDREDLWRLLVTITVRKAAAHNRYRLRQKRGGGAVRGDSVFLGPDGSPQGAGIDDVLGQEPTPEFALTMAEECKHLLDALGDESLRRIAIFKLEGYGTEEIAKKLGCTPQTVRRRLAQIRSKWQSRSGLD